MFLPIHSMVIPSAFPLPVLLPGWSLLVSAVLSSLRALTRGPLLYRHIVLDPPGFGGRHQMFLDFHSQFILVLIITYLLGLGGLPSRKFFNLFFPFI